ncbi:MAG: hypothetical protein ABL903_11775 [Methylococcales bacterium]
MMKILLKSLLIVGACSNLGFADTAPEVIGGDQAIAAETNAQGFLESIQLFQQQSSNGKLARTTSTYYYNTDESKIKALYGKWQVNYLAPEPRNGILDVDGTFVDKNFGYYGWDSKSTFGCYYEPNQFNTIYTYQCLHATDASGKIFERFLFYINGNNLIGKYHSGTASDFITKLTANQLLDFTGSSKKCADSCYDDLTGELSIPKVSVSGKNYSVIMKRENNGLFSLKVINPL